MRMVSGGGGGGGGGVGGGVVSFSEYLKFIMPVVNFICFSGKV